MLEGGPFRGLFLRGLNLDHECGIPSRAPPNVPYLAPDMRNGLVLVHCTLYIVQEGDNQGMGKSDACR